jgi:hypothetical protein
MRSTEHVFCYLIVATLAVLPTLGRAGEYPRCTFILAYTSRVRRNGAREKEREREGEGEKARVPCQARCLAGKLKLVAKLLRPSESS